MACILYYSHMVYKSTVLTVFRDVDCLTMRWGAPHFNPYTNIPSLNEHPELVLFLHEKIAWRKDPELMCSFDYEGVSDARQATVLALEEQASIGSRRLIYA